MIDVVRLQENVTGEGKPIVLVPGGLTGLISWEPHVGKLSPFSKVVRVQLLSVEYGHDDRPLPPDYSVKKESRALAATLDDLGLDAPVDIAAWSFGAVVSLDFALDNPERVRTLTLIEPLAIWLLRAKGSTEDVGTKEALATMESLRGDISEDMLEGFLCNIGLCPLGQSVRDLPQWPVWVQYRQALRSHPVVISYENDIDRLRQFTQPVLLVKGTGSARFLHEIVDTLADLLPNSQVIEMPGGHAPHILSMDQFLKRLESFQAEEARKVA